MRTTHMTLKHSSTKDEPVVNMSTIALTYAWELAMLSFDLAKNRTGLLAFGVVMFLASLGTEAYTLARFIKEIETQSWPTVQGTVLGSELAASTGPSSHEANVLYEFQVDGRRYQSLSVRVRGTRGRNRSELLAVVERYPAGSPCTVHYKPGAPETSYLEVGVDWVSYVIIVSPLIFAAHFGTQVYHLYLRKDSQ